MNTKDLLELEAEIKKEDKRIKQIIEPFADKTKVVMIGPTGSGKSSLSCDLCGEKLIVRFGKGEKIELECEGVMSGGQSITKFPALIPDNNLNLLYCDCPGFEDTEGTISEIKNAFMIDSLFQQYHNYPNKIKILLVFSYSDIDSIRRQVIVENIKRLSKMIPNLNKLKESIGLVITKCEKRRTAKGLIEEMNDNNSDPILSNWCQFFLKNLDHVFLFPMPKEDDIDKKYNSFDDRDRLIKFLQNNPLINPKHQTSLSKYAEENLRRIKLIHQSKEDEIIDDFFTKISSLFNNVTDEKKISQWINGMEELKNVKNTDEFEQIVLKHIPESSKYGSYFQKMKEFESFDCFIDRVFNIDSETSTMQRSIHLYALKCIEELKRTNTLIKADNESKQKIKELENEINKKYEAMGVKGGIWKEIAGPVLSIISFVLHSLCSIC